MLHQNWLMKKELASKISDEQINDLYERALAHGAVGGKLLGAGGGGFLLFYCERQNQERLRQAMLPLQEMQFRFDYEGSKVVYIGDEG